MKTIAYLSDSTDAQDLSNKRLAILEFTHKEGLAAAKAKGKLLGRPKKSSLGRSKLEGREQEIEVLLSKGVSKTSIAKIADVSRTNLLHFIRTRQLGGA